MQSSITTALPVLTKAITLVDTVTKVTNAGNDARAQKQALVQLQEQQDLRLKNAQEDARLQREKIFGDAEEAARKRRDALKRAIAKQRVRFGGQGISSEDGSGEAILLGLFDANQIDEAEAARLDTLRLNALDQDIAQTKRLNVLQATQLAERQKYKTTSLF